MNESLKPNGRNRLWSLVAVVVIASGYFVFQKLSETTTSVRSGKYESAAIVASNQQDWALLEEISRRWVGENPSSGTGWLALAEALQKQSKLEEAQAAYGQVPESDGRYLQALTARAELLYFELSRPYDAVKVWKQILDERPDAGSARQGLISFYAMTLQRMEMIREIREAMKHQCEPIESYVYLFTADRLSFSDAAFRIDNWLKVTPDDETLLVAKAYYLARHGKANPEVHSEFNATFQGDWTLMKGMVERYPQNLNVLAFQVENAIHMGDANLVLNLLNRAPTAAETDSRFWRYRGWLLSQTNSSEDSIESYEKCLGLNPYDWRARLLYADVLRQTAKVSDSEAESALAEWGKQQEKSLLSLKKPTLIEARQVGEMLEYARSVGDIETVDSLLRRGAGEHLNKRTES